MVRDYARTAVGFLGIIALSLAVVWIIQMFFPESTKKFFSAGATVFLSEPTK